MAYKTINVSPATYEMLSTYKHGNMSFDQVIVRLMEKVSEERFYKEVLKEHRRRLKRMKAGDYIERKDLDKALK